MTKGYIFDYGGTLDTAGRHWGKREFAVLIVVVAIVLLLLDIVIHAVRKRRKAKASA